MPRSLRRILHAALRFVPYQHFSNTFNSQIFGADEKTGTGFLLLFSFVFPLAQNKAPGLEKSSRFVECEVKWSSIWLRPRPSLFLPAHWPGTTHTAIYWRQLNFSFIYIFIYLMSQAQELFASSVDFWVGGYAHKHALHHVFCVENCPRQTVLFPHNH